MAEHLPSDPQLDALLDRLVAKAVDFAEGAEDPQTYTDGLSAEGRDILGVRKSKFLPSEESSYPTAHVDESFYPTHPGHKDTVLPVERGTSDDYFGDESEDYGDVDDGRDLHGLRVRPLGE